MRDGRMCGGGDDATATEPNGRGEHGARGGRMIVCGGDDGPNARNKNGERTVREPHQLPPPPPVGSLAQAG